ncbi:MAG TPA: SDR family NAD(P)-dependent oxidoreductase [Methylomirabilota bacterium]|nr:SDR family NAD(P)-dependent oxidoreductase [Methylomirabilota bacterium]
MRLAGQVALVAGASRGIGRAVALAFAREGARVGLLARGRAELDQVAGLIEAAGGSALAVPGDAAEESTAARAVEATLARFGRLDCLVTAQGTGTFGPVEASRLAEWEDMVRGNLTATYLLCRAALPPMLAAGRGTIVAVVSLAAVRAIPGCAAYTASKAGVLGLVRALAAEVRARGVRVAALCPGAVDTPFWDRIPGPPDRSRMLRPEAVADAALLVAVQPPEAFVEEIVLAPTPGVL